MAEIHTKIPFDLLKSCSHKYEERFDIDGHLIYRNPHHQANCMCHGSGLQPTSEGYEILRLLNWAMEYAPWRLSNCRADNMVKVINSFANDNERINIESKKEMDKVNIVKISDEQELDSYCQGLSESAAEQLKEKAKNVDFPFTVKMYV